MADNKEKATRLKTQGNEALMNDRLDEAIQLYSEAIDLDPDNHIFYSNRSAAYVKVGLYDLALRDAEKTVELKPNWVKGYARKGAALAYQKRYSEAETAYRQALLQEPENQELKDALEEIEKKQMEVMNPFAAPDVRQRLMESEKTEGFMKDPDFQRKLEDLAKDPQDLTNHMMDQRVISALSVLLDVDIPMEAFKLQDPMCEKPGVGDPRVGLTQCEGHQETTPTHQQDTLREATPTQQQGHQVSEGVSAHSASPTPTIPPHLLHTVQGPPPSTTTPGAQESLAIVSSEVADQRREEDWCVVNEGDVPSNAEGVPTHQQQQVPEARTESGTDPQAAKKKVEEYRKQRDAARVEIRTLKQELALSQVDVEREGTKVAHCERRIRELEDMVSNMNAEHEAHIKQLRQEFESILAQKDEGSRKAVARARKYGGDPSASAQQQLEAAYQDQIRQKEREFREKERDFQRKQQHYLTQIAQLEDTRDQAKMKEGELSGQIRQKEREFQRRQQHYLAQIAQLEDAREEAKTREGELRRQIERMSQQLQKFEKTANDLTTLVEHTKTQSVLVKELRQQLARVEGDKSQLKMEKDNLSVARDSIQDEISRLQRENEQLRQQVSSLAGQIQRYGQLLRSQRPHESDFWKVPRNEITLNMHKILGTGAWGFVVEGVFRGQKVAVKCLHDMIRQPEVIETIRKEICIMAQIRHPNMVMLIAAVVDAENDPLIVTELLDVTLRKAYEKHLLQGSSKLSIFRDVASALNYLHLHQRGEIIHRDVSSANVLLEAKPNNQWKAKLSDFGSAKLAIEAKTTGPGAPTYTAPEVRKEMGIRQTAKLDVYSYGILLCEVTVEQFPMDGSLPSMMQVVRSKWPFMHGLVTSCIQEHPDNRPTMSYVLEEFDKLRPKE